jgi:GNAT superfamily N-acetyltransferase
MIIRRLTLNELPKALDLIDQFERATAERPSMARLKEILDQISERGGAVLGAEKDGSIVGTCTVAICPNLSWSGRPYAIIENVIVSESYRGQGIGKALLLEAQLLAENAGCYKVALMTGSKRMSTLKFYEACGFVGNKAGFQKRFNA